MRAGGAGTAHSPPQTRYRSTTICLKIYCRAEPEPCERGAQQRRVAGGAGQQSQAQGSSGLPTTTHSRNGVSPMKRHWEFKRSCERAKRRRAMPCPALTAVLRVPDAWPSLGVEGRV
eukprot:955404-Rhodomonas_salina.1